MSATATPRQGDHVFNDLSLALLRPYEIPQALRSAHVDGRHFLHDYLLHAYSLARSMAEAPSLSQGRSLAAFAGEEENALREVANLRKQYPSLARITVPFLRSIHDQNATTFGAAGVRYDVEVLTAVQVALESALAPNRTHGVRTASAGIACQQMIASAYDPAAALVVIAHSASLESTPVQANYHRTVAAIADSLDRPAVWKEPYESFREPRPTETGKKIELIVAVLRRMDMLRAQGSTLSGLITNELHHKAALPEAADKYGAILHLLHMRLQQLRG